MTYRVAFLGTPEFAVPSLKALLWMSEITVACVLTQPDKPRGRGQVLSPSPVKAVALEHNLEVFQPRRLRKEMQQVREKLNAFGTLDAAVVVAFGQILPKEFLELFPCGCINVHGSLLPRWRGAAPMQRAIMAGDTETGVCLMKMDEGLDTGDVYSTASIPILPTDNLESVHNSLATLGANLLEQNLLKILRGEVLPSPQPQEGVTYAHKIAPDECLLDWSMDPRALSCHVRGLWPFPGAYTFWQGVRLKVANALPEEDFDRETELMHGELMHGTVVSVTPDKIVVSCREGAVGITLLQREGKKLLPVKEFIKGNAIKPGQTLGQ